MTQNFGPEARGGACSAQLVLSDKPVLYPYVTQPDILVVMSQEAYVKFSPELKARRADADRAGPGARLRHSQGHADLRHPGHPHCRGNRQAHGD